MLDLAFTTEQEMLREVVRNLLAEHSPPGVVRAMEDDPVGYPVDLWQRLAGLDLLGLLLPEAHGGSGMGSYSTVWCSTRSWAGRWRPPPLRKLRGQWHRGRSGRHHGARAEWLPQVLKHGRAHPGMARSPTGASGAGCSAGRPRPTAAPAASSRAASHVAFAAAAARLVVVARTGEADCDIDLFLVDPGARG